MTFKIVKWPTGKKHDREVDYQIESLNLNEFPKSEECIVKTFSKENEKSLDLLRYQVIDMVEDFKSGELKKSFEGHGYVGALYGTVLAVGSLPFLVTQSPLVCDAYSKMGKAFLFFLVVEGAAVGAAIQSGIERLEYGREKRRYKRKIKEILNKPSTEYFMPVEDSTLFKLNKAIKNGEPLDLEENKSLDVISKEFDEIQRIRRVMGDVLTPKAKKVYEKMASIRASRFISSDEFTLKAYKN